MSAVCIWEETSEQCQNWCRLFNNLNIHDNFVHLNEFISLPTPLPATDDDTATTICVELIRTVNTVDL